MAPLGFLTGKNVEEAVQEFSETFTEVVVGLHEDVETLKTDVSKLEKKPATSCLLLLTSIAALIMSIIALVIVL